MLALLGVCVLTDGSLIALNIAATHNASAVVLRSLYRPGFASDPVPPPYGYDPVGQPLNVLRPGRTVKGWVVRYAARDCHYCREDAQWPRLANELEDLHYQVIILLPNAKQAFSKNDLVPSDALQEAFVSMDWVKQFRLNMTPTVLIFDCNQHLIWFQRGMLSPTARESALHAVTAAKARGWFARTYSAISDFLSN